MAIESKDIKLSIITGIVFSIATLVLIQATKGIGGKG